jgi:putative ABC transport system permease protein
MESLAIAATALRAHKLRSILTLLGVIIGVMTVVVVVSITSGLNRYVAERLFQLSPDVLIFDRFGIITSRDEFLEAIKRKKLDMDDFRAVSESCRSCDLVGAGSNNRLAVRRGSRRMPGTLIRGVTPSIADLMNLDVEYGRFFTQNENAHAALTVVLGTDVRDELFPGQDPIGRKVWVGGNPMTVIGLFRKQGSVLGQSQDNLLVMPLNTFQKQFGNRQNLNIFVRPLTGVQGLQATEDEVRTILRTRRHTPFNANDPFGVVTAAAAQQVWRGISSGAFALMFFVSGISLIVGGIVIMNIMLVSVVERTREIGIRRAAGARRRDILSQFLLEAVLLGLVGGIIGVVAGWGGAKAVEAFSPMPTQITMGLVLIGLAISVLTGALAGFIPARKAATIPPVEALRYE